MKSAIGSAIAAVGSFLLGVAGLVVLVLLGALWVYGVAWVSSRTIEYLFIATHFMTGVCILIFLPLAIFRFSRIVAVFGLFGSSFLFGVCTWVLGFLVTLQFWGAGGVIIGLILGVVGIVPLGGWQRPSTEIGGRSLCSSTASS
jgi:hypothetical protein